MLRPACFLEIVAEFMKERALNRIQFDGRNLTKNCTPKDTEWRLRRGELSHITILNKIPVEVCQFARI